MTSIPRKFSKGVDAAKEETELQQLYTELDAVREQLVLTLDDDFCSILRSVCMLRAPKCSLSGG